jgi:8-oxo-dGTP diphosphatase
VISRTAEAAVMRTPAAGHTGEMLAVNGVPAARRVFFHDPEAPRATAVVPSAFVAVRSAERLLLVRRSDSGTWELPGGRVDVGETPMGAALREVREESGVRVRITGFVGLFTDPQHVVRAVDGTVRQLFVVVFLGAALGGTPHGDLPETSEAAWVDVADLPGLPMEPPVRTWIRHAVHADGDGPHLD